MIPSIRFGNIENRFVCINNYWTLIWTWNILWSETSQLFVQDTPSKNDYRRKWNSSVSLALRYAKYQKSAPRNTADSLTVTTYPPYLRTRLEEWSWAYKAEALWNQEYCRTEFIQELRKTAVACLFTHRKTLGLEISRKYREAWALDCSLG